LETGRVELRSWEGLGRRTRRLGDLERGRVVEERRGKKEEGRKMRETGSTI
jgi:hypothetical protein